MSEAIQFVEHEKCQDDTSIWKFFLKDRSKQFAKCVKCSNVLKTAGGSTSSLHKHMKNVHSISTLKRQAERNDSIISTSSSLPAATSNERPKKSKISDYYNVVESETLQLVIARMASLDGIPFDMFCKSEDLRKGLTARGFQNIPTSHNTIREYVLGYANQIRQRVILQLKHLKSDDTKFSITCDEWSSLRSRRYLNVNVHSHDFTWNLGLIRAHGHLPAEKVCNEVIISNLGNQIPLFYR